MLVFNDSNVCKWKQENNRKKFEVIFNPCNVHLYYIIIHIDIYCNLTPTFWGRLYFTSDGRVLTLFQDLSYSVICICLLFNVSYEADPTLLYRWPDGWVPPQDYHTRYITIRYCHQEAWHWSDIHIPIGPHAHIALILLV